MVYKKYIEKNGKVYGPYTYHSERVNGKVVSKYLGNEESRRGSIKNVSNKINSNFLWIAIGVFAFLLLIFVGFQLINKGGISGKVSLDVETTYEESEALQGNLKLSLKKGELLPKNSKILIEDSQGNSYEYFLSEVVGSDVSSISGDYYIEGENIVGSGEGYGSSGTAVVYPTVYFTLDISGAGTSEEEVEESEGVEEEEAVAEEEEEVNETAGEEEQEEIEEEVEEVEEEEEETTGTGNVIFNFFAGVLGSLTGQATLDVETEIDGEVSGDEPFTYTVAEGQTASIVSGSVRTDSEELSDNDVSLIVDGNQITVTTDYFQTSEGFGEEYLGNVDTELNINLSSLNIDVSSGILQIKIVYNGENIVTSSVNLVAGETIQTTNETILQNQTNVTIEAFTESYVSLTDSEKEALLNEFVNLSLDTTKAEVVNGRLFVKHELGDYWVEYTYDYSSVGITDNLRYEIEQDKLKWLKDLAKALIDSNVKISGNNTISELIGNSSLSSIESYTLSSVQASNQTIGNETQELEEESTANETESNDSESSEIGNETPELENNETA